MNESNPTTAPLDLDGFPNVKTAFPFNLAVDTRTFGLPLAQAQTELGYKIDAFQLHIALRDGVPQLPDPKEIEVAKASQKELALSTVIHLEPDPRLGHPASEVREKGVQALIEIVERVRPLIPNAYVVELVPPDPWQAAPPRSLTEALGGESGLADWKKRIVDSFTEVVESCRVPFPNFCLETSNYPIAEIIDIANQQLFSFCLDIATLFRLQFNITEHIESLMSRTKVFHLHGVSPAGEPHSSLGHFPFDHIVGFLGTLTSAHYVGSVCLEIRFLPDLIESLHIADKAYREMRGFS